MQALPLQRCAAPGIPAAFPPASIVPLCPAHCSCPTTALPVASPFIQRQNLQISGKQDRTPPPALPSCRGHPCTRQRCLGHRSVPALSLKDQVQNCLHIVVGNSSKLSAEAWPFALLPGSWHLYCRNRSSANVKSGFADRSHHLCVKTHESRYWVLHVSYSITTVLPCFLATGTCSLFIIKCIMRLLYYMAVKGSVISKSSHFLLNTETTAFNHTWKAQVMPCHFQGQILPCALEFLTWFQAACKFPELLRWSSTIFVEIGNIKYYF